MALALTIFAAYVAAGALMGYLYGLAERRDSIGLVFLIILCPIGLPVTVGLLTYDRGRYAFVN